MRVIAGTHRRRQLLGPRGASTTRPITDRVKQSLFDMLWSHGALNGGTALDLFCGTGSLGIEALSRGVDHCLFVDSDRSAVGLLKQNLDTLNLTERATVAPGDATALGYISKLNSKTAKVIFCDPPYALIRDTDASSKLVGSLGKLVSAATPNATLILRTPDTTPPPEITAWQKPDSTHYGSMSIHRYERL